MKNFIYIFYFAAQFLYAQNLIITEQFSNCTLPGNWSLNSESGNYNFTIAKSNLMPQSDATCSVIYSQLIRNDKSQKKFSITTNEFSLFSYEAYTLTYGLRFIKTNLNASLKLYTIIDGIKTLHQSYNSDVVQNPFVLVVQSSNISASAFNKKIQFQFEYTSDGDDYNTLILIDNLYLNGPDNDDCTRAVNLKLNANCLSGNNTGAFMSGPKILCSGNYSQALWYFYKSDFTGTLNIRTGATFNDAISIYEGTCPSLTDIQCFNNDEYGFTGERNYIQVANGKTYYFRVARQTGFYGRDDLSDLCIAISKEDPVYPSHDLCANSIPVVVNVPCTKASNIIADFSNPIPSLNNKSRADVWYNFKPTSTQDLIISSNADFADVITIYKGSCSQLEEVKCEDLGGKLVLSSPVIGLNYFIQVSGYFSTIEGHICLEVKTKSQDKPSNEDCLTSKAINLNSGCQSISTINSTKSNIKPSCVVYTAPDVWFSFIAPTEKNVAIHIESGFLYNWAVYSGICTNLQEFDCGKTPDPCSGFITLSGLTPGKVYYLQIISAVNPLKPSEGQLCVKIEELSKAVPFSKLNLDLQLECLHGVLGSINYLVSGGMGQYTYHGPGPSEIFYPGTLIEAFVEDETGCRDFKRITIDCKPPVKCKNSTLDLSINTECLKDSLGRQTGKVILHITGKGGTGAYYYYGTQDGSQLNHEDTYKVILIDSDSCYIIEEGRINCPPFDCNQSNLAVSADYICVDTLLKAILQVDVKGNLGNFTITGNKHGDLLDQGALYQVQVTDEAGCSSMTSGEIACKFDSCAYSRPELQVNYECLLDEKGQINGKAKLLIHAESKAGGIQIKGGNSGDTLNHLDNYLISMIDSFGCELFFSGTIYCNVVKNDQSKLNWKTIYYPNPANDKLTINLPEYFNQDVHLSLFTSTGSLLCKKMSYTLSKSHSLQINLEKITPGIYFIKLEGIDFYDIIRFVKI